MSMSSKNNYLNNIGFVRVFSCIVVLLYHMNILKGGYLAVCIFFVISGYFSVVSLLKKEKVSLIDYYLKKLKKLYLPLLIVVFISTGIITLFNNINWYNLKPEVTSVLLGYNNFWQLNANLDYFASHSTSPFMHLWYMGIILQFELIFPLVFILLKKLGDKLHKTIPCLISFILAVTSIIFFFYSSVNSNIMVTYYNTLSRVYALLLGVSLGFISHYFKNNKLLKFKNKKINTVIFYTYILIIFVWCLLVESNSKYFAIIMFLTTIFSLRLITYGNNTSNKKLNIFDKIIKSISDISYEIYLIQYPIIFLFQFINLNVYLEIFLIILITILLSYLLSFSLNFKKEKFKIIRVVVLIIIVIPTIFGVYKYIISKDYTEEMNALEEKLAANTKIMEENNKIYAEKLKQEQAIWEETLKNLENGEAELKNIVSNLPIVAIGDSVMLGAIPELQKRFPNGYFDAAVSRTAYKANGIMNNLSYKGLLGEPIIFNLGTNGDCDDQTKELIMQTVGNRKLFWVNVTNNNEVGVNEKLNYYASKYNNLYIIDWNSVASNHPEYFIADRIHLTAAGKEAYTNTIYDAIYKVYHDEYNAKKQTIINEHNNIESQKITFIGNSLLINAYNLIQTSYPNSEIVTDSKYNYELIKKELTKKINNNSLTNKVVLLFDKNSELTIFEYKKIIEICNEYELYIISTNNNLNELNSEKIHIIDFKEKLKDNSDYLMADGIHLSEKGNIELNKIIKEKLDNK